MSREDFEAAVADALDGVPEDLARQMRNVVILVEDDPPGGARLLGLYEGTPLTRRGDGWAGSLPDRITIFRNPILAACHSAPRTKCERSHEPGLTMQTSAEGRRPRSGVMFVEPELGCIAIEPGRSIAMCY